jgi:hypothetical protein
MDSFGSEQGPAAGCCESSNELPGCVKVGIFLTRLVAFTFLK